MSSRYRIHPRGFLGVDTGKAQNVRTEKPFSDIFGLKSYRIGNISVSGNTIPSNPEIHSLYSRSVVEPKSGKSIEFQEDVYRAAIEVFGGKANGKMINWFNVQFDNRLAGDLHSRYLCDLVRYVNGVDRTMSNHGWKCILAITDEGDDIGKIPELITKFVPDHMKVTEFLAKWLSKEDGFNDLLINLQIMFGDVNV